MNVPTLQQAATIIKSRIDNEMLAISIIKDPKRIVADIMDTLYTHGDDGYCQWNRSATYPRRGGSQFDGFQNLGGPMSQSHVLSSFLQCLGFIAETQRLLKMAMGVSEENVEKEICESLHPSSLYGEFFDNHQKRHELFSILTPVYEASINPTMQLMARIIRVYFQGLDELRKVYIYRTTDASLKAEDIGIEWLETKKLSLKELVFKLADAMIRESKQGDDGEFIPPIAFYLNHLTDDACHCLDGYFSRDYIIETVELTVKARREAMNTGDIDKK